ncbi:MAG TPA: universal stress protein [Nitrososphaeraceae archaeon]|nr:universal stress protein [Nitrososphaeraceae archaeon]
MVKPKAKAKSVSVKKILVPVDGSEISFKAANYAIHIAKLANAQLIPLNIIEDVKQGGAIGLQERYGNISVVKGFKKARKQSAEDWLTKIEKSAEELGVRVKSVILDAEGKNEKKMVTEYAVKNNVDLIVIGSKGRSIFKGLWIGGFTNSVLHHSTVPVLVVP